MEMSRRGYGDGEEGLMRSGPFFMLQAVCRTIITIILVIFTIPTSRLHLNLCAR